MKTHPAPPLIAQPQTAREIARSLESLLVHRLRQPAGPGEPPREVAEVDNLRSALMQIGARYGEVVTRCMNAAPELHLQAFSGLLGGRPRPAEAARVHLSFKPASGRSTVPIIVPRNTRVAAAAPAGDTEPVIFETQADLQLVRANAVRAVAVDSGHGHRVDVSAMVRPADGGELPPAMMEPVVQALHIGDLAAFGLAGLRQVVLRVDVLDAGARSPSSGFGWSVPSSQGDVPLVIESDSTGGLMHSGDIVLRPPPVWPVSSVDGIASRWLTLRLQDGYAAGAPAPTPAPVPMLTPVITPMAQRPPRLRALALQAIAATPPVPPVAASQGGVPLDISKDAFPFGERPRFGQTFELHSPAFGEPGARVELAVWLTNPEGSATAPIPTVSREGKPVLAWEISTDNGFVPIAVSDGTRSLTRDGTVRFTVPNEVSSVSIAGKKGAWLRARLASGHYGGSTPVSPSTVASERAPAIRKMVVSSILERGPVAPEHLVSQGALTTRRIDPRLPWPIDAFVPADTPQAALYIALDAAEGALMNGSVLSWHVQPVLPDPPLAVGAPEPGQATAKARWQMRQEGGWTDLSADDDSLGFTRSGIVRVHLPGPPAAWLAGMLEPEARLVWLRLLWAEEASLATGPAGAWPRRLTLNSVGAQQSQQLRHETVGSSNGRSAQAFRALRTPIVGGVDLQVREASDEWVTWQEVDDLALCRSTTRAYTVDRSTGALRFGDGRFGRIPPMGANNIRLRAYTTGGGVRGNRPAGAIAQLLGTIPHVESVVNLEPAHGGLDVEAESRVRDHALGWLRHRDRAVCADDFADLALGASPEVARAYCVAGRDLSAPPRPAVTGPASRAGTPALEAGIISVIVIPQGLEPRPQPGFGLLSCVKAWLDARRALAGRLVVVGPTYASVAVRVAVVARPDYSPHEVAAECDLRIARFLHPLHGGSSGAGWELGQRPHRSDLYGLLGAIDGVHTVRSLSLRIDAPVGLPFVISAGAIDVAATE